MLYNGQRKRRSIGGPSERSGVSASVSESRKAERELSALSVRVWLGTHRGHLNQFSHASGREEAEQMNSLYALNEGRYLPVTMLAVLGAAMMAIGALPGSAQALTLNESTKLLPSDGAPNDRFGMCVAISGTMASVGAWHNNDNGPYAGTSYLFDATTGSQAAKLTPLDPSEYDDFGYSVSIDGNITIVGAVGDDDNGESSGSAYLFNVSTGSQIAKLTASDGAAYDIFGRSVSISGNTAIVGAYRDEDNGHASGSAYVFRDQGAGSWSQIAKIIASDGEINDSFGRSVSIDGDTAIIGAMWDGDNGYQSGSAYVFHDDGSGNWLEMAKLTPFDGAAGDQFGSSVAISGDTAIVGATGDSNAGPNPGSAYIFQDDGSGNWLQIAKLIASDAAVYDGFGASVSIDGDTVIIGASHDDDSGSGSGSAYLFQDDGSGNWLEIAKLLASDGAVDDRFGYSVSISGSQAVVGGYRNDGLAGSAYLFDIPEPASLMVLALGGAALLSRRPGIMDRTASSDRFRPVARRVCCP